MNNEQMIENIKKRLLFRYPHFGAIIDSVEIVEDKKKTATAGTDAKKIYYNSEYISNLSEDEQLFVFAHEVCHIAFDHIYRSKGKNPILWNIATDAVINAFLKEDGLPIVKGGVDIKDAIKYKAEQIYQKLLEKQEEEKKKQKNSNKGQSESGNSNGSAGNQSQTGSGASSNGNPNEQNNSGSDSNPDEENDSKNENPNNENMDSKQNENPNDNENNGSNANGNKPENEEEEARKNDVGHDTHSMWEKAVKERDKELEEKEKGSSPQDNEDNNEKNESKSNSTENEDKDTKENEESNDNKKDKSEEIDERKEFEKNKEKVKEMLDKYQEKKASDSMNAGKSTNSEQINIADIGVSKQLVDWRKLLKEAIKYNIDWSYKNAIIEDGIVKAQLERYPIPETEIVIDTSGSVSETLIRNFLRECKNIIKVSNVTAGCFDTRFYGFQKIRSYKDIDNFIIKGRGGTDFNVAVNAFSKRVMNKIIFTDGKATMPMDDRYVIWVIFGGHKIYPKKGRVIYINDEDLYRLISDYPSKGR